MSNTGVVRSRRPSTTISSTFGFTVFFGEVFDFDVGALSFEHDAPSWDVGVLFSRALADNVRRLFAGRHDAEGGGCESKTTSESESSPASARLRLPLSSAFIVDATLDVALQRGLSPGKLFWCGGKRKKTRQRRVFVRQERRATLRVELGWWKGRPGRCLAVPVRRCLLLPNL